MKTKLLSIISVCVLCSCAERTVITTNCGETIDVATALDNVTDNFEQLIDTSWMVALKTPKDFLLSTITKAKAADDKIYVFDELNTKRLNAHDRDGNFLFSVVTLGRGPKELLNATDFSIYKDEVFVTDPIQKRTQVYSTADGSFLRTLTHPFAALEFHKLNDNCYLFVLTDYNEDLGEQYLAHSVVVTDSMYVVKHWAMKHPIANKCNNFNRSNWNIVCDTNFYSMYDENIWSYDAVKNNIKCLYSFDYGKDNIPQEQRNDINTFMKFYEDDKLQITTESPIVAGDYVFANTSGGGKKHFIAHKKGDRTIAMTIHPEAYKLNLPWFILGKSDEDALISNVEYTFDPASLNDFGVENTDGVSNVILFTKFK